MTFVDRDWILAAALGPEGVINIENRIYREEFTGKKCKTAILLYCFHTAGVLHIFMPYNLVGPGILFYRKSMPFTLQTMIFRYNYKSNDVFYSPNSL